MIPQRDGILPSSVNSQGISEQIEDVPAAVKAGDVLVPGSVVLGADLKPDTLLPGDPVHEPAGIDPEDTAARMLLGIMNFLEEGDVTTFAPEDRRDWTTEVLNSVEEIKMRETAAATFGISQESLQLGESATMHLIDEGSGNVDLAHVPPEHLCITMPSTSPLQSALLL